jgi:hypothetical protein
MEKLVLTQRKLSEIKNGLVNGLTIASGAKSSATYYHSRDEQKKAIVKSVSDLYDISKELPLILANQGGVTGVFIQEVLLNEFKKTSNGGSCNIINPLEWYDNQLSDKAILGALKNLDENSGITYILRLFEEFKDRKINNDRARKIALFVLLNNNNLEFYSIKYRNKLNKILRHIYGEKMVSVLVNIMRKYLLREGLYETDNELKLAEKHILRYNSDTKKIYKLLLFILKEYNGVDYGEFELISEYFKAKENVLEIKNIPEEVLIGLISNKNHPQYNDLWSTEDKRESTKALFRKNNKVTSVNQQVRQTKSTKKLGVEKTVEYSKATDFLALYKTGYETGFTDEIKLAINTLAEKNKISNFYYENIGIIIDKSPSMSGHKQESKNTPRAISSFTSLVLSKSAKNTEMVSVEGVISDLATGFVNLLQKEKDSKSYDAIFILSDGYENSYDGLLNEVVQIYLNETDRVLPIYHVSPITAAETGGDVRSLGNNFVSLSVNNPKGIQTQIDSKLLDVDVKLWLEKQIFALESSNLRRS